MENNNNIPDGLADENAIASGSAAPKGTGISEGAETISVKELEQILGKTFKTKDSALKSVKDTYAFVGAPKPAAPSVADETIKNELKGIKADLFYSQNPQYAPYKAVISKMGENPTDVIGTEEFKNVFDNLAAFDKLQKSKTVLESNSRVGQVTDKMTEAKALASKYSTYEKGKAIAMEALIEATGLKR